MAIRFEDKADAPKPPRRPAAADVGVVDTASADVAHPKPEPKAKGRKKKA